MGLRRRMWRCRAWAVVARGYPTFRRRERAMWPAYGKHWWKEIHSFWRIRRARTAAILWSTTTISVPRVGRNFCPPSKVRVLSKQSCSRCSPVASISCVTNDVLEGSRRALRMLSPKLPRFSACLCESFARRKHGIAKPVVLLEWAILIRTISKSNLLLFDFFKALDGDFDGVEGAQHGVAHFVGRRICRIAHKSRELIKDCRGAFLQAGQLLFPTKFLVGAPEQVR